MSGHTSSALLQSCLMNLRCAIAGICLIDLSFQKIQGPPELRRGVGGLCGSLCRPPWRKARTLTGPLKSAEVLQSLYLKVWQLGFGSCSYAVSVNLLKLRFASAPCGGLHTKHETYCAVPKVRPTLSNQLFG